MATKNRKQKNKKRLSTSINSENRIDSEIIPMTALNSDVSTDTTNVPEASSSDSLDSDSLEEEKINQSTQDNNSEKELNTNKLDTLVSNSSSIKKNKSYGALSERELDNIIAQELNDLNEEKIENNNLNENSNNENDVTENQESLSKNTKYVSSNNEIEDTAIIIENSSSSISQFSSDNLPSSTNSSTEEDLTMKKLQQKETSPNAQDKDYEENNIASNIASQEDANVSNSTTILPNNTSKRKDVYFEDDEEFLLGDDSIIESKENYAIVEQLENVLSWEIENFYTPEGTPKNKRALRENPPILYVKNSDGTNVEIVLTRELSGHFAQLFENIHRAYYGVKPKTQKNKDPLSQENINETISNIGEHLSNNKIKYIILAILFVIVFVAPYFI